MNLSPTQSVAKELADSHIRIVSSIEVAWRFLVALTNIVQIVDMKTKFLGS